MTSRFSEIVVDCHDPRALAAFWAEVLDYVVDEDGDEDDEFVAIGPYREDGEAWRARFRAGVSAPVLVFGQVPEDKAVKNRLHIDVSPVDRTHAAEVERLLALGATRADVGQQGDETWTVLADPEGNEFCVLSSLMVDG
jgi:hypothetical protein